MPQSEIISHLYIPLMVVSIACITNRESLFLLSTVPFLYHLYWTENPAAFEMSAVYVILFPCSIIVSVN